ncbi:hydroxymethylbilane synthase [soil metagenome]
MTLRIGTRGSALALAQAKTVASKLGAELIEIQSEGDRTTASLASLGGAGVFAAALREALLAGEVDAVVHSYKDLPTAPTPGLSIAAVPKRGDARDALVARDRLTLAELPAGSVVGTGSSRRRAQLLSRRSDIDVVELRGNIDTRIGRVGPEGGDVDPERRLDAVVLAAAGLDRISRPDTITEYFGITGWPTAPAQGALAIETRTGDEKSVAKLEHTPSRLTVEAERAVLALLEAGCAAPIGAHAIYDDGLLFLDARVYREDGSEYLTSSHALYPEDSRDPIGELAKRVTDELLAGGAAELAPLSASRDIRGPGVTE